MNSLLYCSMMNDRYRAEVVTSVSKIDKGGGGVVDCKYKISFVIRC